jgi:hypothetical protein
VLRPVERVDLLLESIAIELHRDEVSPIRWAGAPALPS